MLHLQKSVCKLCVNLNILSNIYNISTNKTISAVCHSHHSQRELIGNGHSSISLLIAISNFLCLCSQVGNSLGSMQVGLKEHLDRLDEIFSPRGDYTQTLRFMQQMANNIIQQLTAMPDTRKVQVDLAAIADQTAFIEYYR